MSEEEDGGKRVDKSSSSDDYEDKNQYKDNNNKANKEKITTSFWENNSDEENEWYEQGSTDGDKQRWQNTRWKWKNYVSNNVEHKDDSNKQKSGGTSKIRGDDDITGIGRKDKKKGKKKGKGLKRKRY